MPGPVLTRDNIGNRQESTRWRMLKCGHAHPAADSTTRSRCSWAHRRRPCAESRAYVAFGGIRRQRAGAPLRRYRRHAEPSHQPSPTRGRRERRLVGSNSRRSGFFGGAGAGPDTAITSAVRERPPPAHGALSIGTHDGTSLAQATSSHRDERTAFGGLDAAVDWIACGSRGRPGPAGVGLRPRDREGASAGRRDHEGQHGAVLHPRRRGSGHDVSTGRSLTCGKWLGSGRRRDCGRHAGGVRLVMGSAHRSTPHRRRRPPPRLRGECRR